ncbi:unnamed protein product [Protopolystoma xenopodis]|uniref:Uncharacterized protein n=1 Tax=Protopolystoma xenopodis TaxID=117903 RepID=A0A448WYP6_9PLAT|nr:unnamed protein product [Protopolystoma xenopodis]
MLTAAHTLLTITTALLNGKILVLRVTRCPMAGRCDTLPMDFPSSSITIRRQRPSGIRVVLIMGKYIIWFLILSYDVVAPVFAIYYFG